MLNKLMTKVKEAQKEYELAKIESDNASAAYEKAQSLYWKLTNVTDKKKKELREAEEKLLNFIKG